VQQNRVEALNEAIHKFGPPEIMNTDQGLQFNSFAWTDRLKRIGSRISMDGKGRYLDNVFIERLWRSLKYVCVYLHSWETRSQASAASGLDHLLQPPSPTHCPWQSTARRDLLQNLRNRPAGAGISLNLPEICPRIGE
jgi:hypothetical protein